MRMNFKTCHEVDIGVRLLSPQFTRQVERAYFLHSDTKQYYGKGVRPELQNGISKIVIAISGVSSFVQYYFSHIDEILILINYHHFPEMF
jgi:hypothetical protein